MKNKEIEELLNNLKSVYELNKPLTDKYKEDCMRFVINTKEAELLLSYIEQLEKKVDQYENPDDLTLFYMWLDEKAKDKMKQLENNRDKAIEKLVIKQLRYLNEPHYKLTTLDLEEIKNILKGDSDE